MKNKGFTLVEIIISLVILVAIGLVVGTGLSKVFDKSSEVDYETLVNKVISSADVYLTNNTTLLNELNSSRGYVVVKVTDLIDEKLLEPLVNPETGETVGATAEDKYVKATLDSHGVLKLSYPSETTTESYLEAQNKLVEFNTSFACENVSTYASEWGTSTLRLINANGTVNTTASIHDVINNVSCNVNMAEPGTYQIVYTYTLPDSGVSKELTRTLIVSPAMSDMISLSATISSAKVAINNPVTVTVRATNRLGESRVLSASEYQISSLATNVAGKFTPTITSLIVNSDKSVPTTTVTYTVVDNVSELINDDGKCVNQTDSSCWYIGNQTGNYLTYANKTWRIYKKNADNSIALVLNNIAGPTYAFTSLTDNYNCSPTSCCNSSQSLNSSQSSYLLTQNPNGLNTYLTSSFLNTLTNHSTYVNNTVFNITGYGSSTSASITQKVGLLSYAEYSKIASCSTFSCGSNYLNTGNDWGLGTFYRTNVKYSSTYNLATGSFNRYVAPRYNTSLYVSTNGNVAEAQGAFTLNVSNSGRTVTSNSGKQLHVKPVIVLKSGTKITGGNGTVSNPYKVG